MPVSRIIRFWVIPLISLIATFLVPANTCWLWLLWGIAFVSTIECSCSSWAMGRPAFWVGLHLLPIFLI